jgi:hypothetical protein
MMTLAHLSVCYFILGGGGGRRAEPWKIFLRIRVRIRTMHSVKFKTDFAATPGLWHIWPALHERHKNIQVFFDGFFFLLERNFREAELFQVLYRKTLADRFLLIEGV